MGCNASILSPLPRKTPPAAAAASASLLGEAAALRPDIERATVVVKAGAEGRRVMEAKAEHEDLELGAPLAKACAAEESGFCRHTAQAVRDRILLSRDTHTYASEFFRHRYFLLSVPSVVLAATVGVVEVVVPGDGPWRKAAVATLSAVNTCLITVSNMYGFQSVKDQHFQAAKMYSGLLTEFDYSVWFPGQENQDVLEKALKVYLEHAQKRIAELVTHLPPVPMFIHEQVKRQHQGGARSYDPAFYIQDPALESFRGFMDLMPALGAASVAMWDLVGSEDGSRNLPQGVAMAIFALQCVIWIAVSSPPPDGSKHSVIASAYGMLFGPEGVASVALLTWSFVYLLRRSDLWQLAFALPQSFALLFAVAQRRPRGDYTAVGGPDGGLQGFERELR